MGPPVCAVYALTLGLRASTLAMKLEGAMKPQGRAFIGEPPAEIALLLHDTIATAKKVTRTQERLPAKCITETRINRCTRLGFHFYEATKDLQEALDAWEPYL